LKVILQFKTHKELWDYKVLNNSDCVQINTRELILHCHGSDAAIALAIKQYNAVAIQAASML
jgi:hypothetical protein